MAIFTAEQQADTSTLQQLAAVGNGSDFSGFFYTGPADFDPDNIEFFHSPNALHILLTGGESDLVIGAGQPVAMTVTAVNVEANNATHDKIFDLSGIGVSILDLYNDATDNGHLDTIPAQIFNGDDTITGSPFGDVLYGFAGDDTISGGAGNDVIRGGRGADTLSGGAGKDQFFFNDGIVKGQFDTVLDFQHKVDDFLLDPSLFKGVHATATGINPANFHAGSHAADKSDRIIYNRQTGALLYDQDGTGTHFHQIKFAELPHAPVLNANDFLLISN